MSATSGDDDLCAGEPSPQPFSIGDWDIYRPRLTLLAATGLDKRLRAKLDPADIVQQTFLQAHKALASFRGSSEVELVPWLKQILTRNLIHATREFRASRRDVAREISLQGTPLNVDRILAKGGNRPADVAEKNEQHLRVLDAIAALPEAQGLAVELHHLLGWPVIQVAESMGRSPVAVAGLLKRGMTSLRFRLRIG